MIDFDLMQDRIRSANPVPDPDQLDAEEFTWLVERAGTPPHAADSIEGRLVARRPQRKRGPLVAIATAGVALGLVAVAIVAARSFDGDQVADDVQPPAVTSPPATSTAPRTSAPPTTSTAAPSPVLFTDRLVPTQGPDPSPISTTIGALEFEMLEFESLAHGLYRIEWTPHGLVGAKNDRLYWTTDYYNWHSVGTSVPADSVTVIDQSVVVHGNGGTVRYEWNGTEWIEEATLDISDVERLTFGPDGAVALVGNRLLFSTDGLHFERAEEGLVARSSLPAERGSCPSGFGPLGSGRPVLATEAGYVTFTSKWPGMAGQHPMCEPITWFSPDGDRWVLISEESPFGESAAVYEIEERDGRFVAVGATDEASAVAWVSNDGVAWEPIEFALDFIDGIAGGGLGWVLTGANAADEQLIFFSTDGFTWDGPYERPEALNTGYLPPQLTVGDDVIFGIGGRDYDALLARLQQ